MPLITHGSYVRTCDCALRGRVNMVYPTALHGRWLRVQFPPRSPFFDDWALYHESEVALYTEPRIIDVAAWMKAKLPGQSKTRSTPPPTP